MKIARIIVYTGSRFMLKDTVNAPSLFTISIVTKNAKEVQTTARNNSHNISDRDIVNMDMSNLLVAIKKIVKPMKPTANSYILM